MNWRRRLKPFQPRKLGGIDALQFQVILEGRHKMETLANLESFAHSAEEGSFSGAARRMALTPAAISRNVGMLEQNLGVRLFQQSTRNLTLTEAGERFLADIGDKLEGLQAAISDV